MTWTRRALGATALVAALVALAGLAPVASASAEPVSPVPDVEASPCGERSWVAGTVEVCAGVVTYLDYVYDDFGATTATGSIPRGDAYGFLPPAGGQQELLPTEQRAMHDIARVQLRRGAGVRVDAAVELAGLRDPATTRVVLAVDHDPAGATGGGALPGLVANPDLSLPPTAPGWDEVVELSCAADINTCTGSFDDADGAFRTWALTARPDGTVMNVAFRGTTETGFWWDQRQAGALVGGDIGAFALDVAAADLDPATTRRAETPRGVVLQRVYTSAFPLGEGVSDTGVGGPADDAAGVGQAFHLLGRYLPYGFVLPAGDGPHGVQLVLHGLAENHSARLYFPTADGSFVDRFAGDLDRVLVSPTGRGWRGWWSGYAERDAFDALADVLANYGGLDRDAMVVSGYSMGGYGTLRLGALFPDLWAGAINWVGYTGDIANGTPFAGNGGAGGALGNAVELLASLRHVPIANVYGVADELVQVNQALNLRDELARNRIRSVHWLHPTGEHVSPILADDWSKEAAWSAGVRRVARPLTVTFRTDERFFLPELGIVPDHAYWVADIDPAGAGYADVEARSEGCGGAEPVREVRPLAAGPVDPPPLLASVVQEVVDVGSTPVAAAPRLAVTTRNVASLTVDTGDGGACLAGKDVEWRITTDGPLTVRLTDGRAVVLDAAGDHAGTLTAAGAVERDEVAPPPATAAPGPVPAPVATGPRPLARTGGPVPVAAAVVLLVAGLASRRLRRAV